MRLRMVHLAFAALTAAACQHPFADAGLQGALQVEPASAAVYTRDAEDVVLASATLRALLRQHGGAPVTGGGNLPAARSAPAVSLARASWLETQSTALRVLADRSRSAYRSHRDTGAKR
jgi:hypothetical protein